MSFGNELKTAREAQGLSLQDVAQRTRIRTDYLRALEAQDLPVLPERTLTRSYLQQYARALGLDPAPLAQEYDRLVPQSRELTQATLGPASQATRARTGRVSVPPRRPPRPGLPVGLLGSVVAVALVLGVAGYFGYTAYQAQHGATANAPTTEVALPSTRQVNLTVSSTPTGARVYVDNRYLGLTPIQGWPLDARDRAELRVEYGGRQTYKETLKLQSDRTLSVKLAPAGQVSSASTPTPSTPRVSATAARTPARTPSTPVAATPSAPAPPAAGRVRLSFRGASWTLVTDRSGRVLYRGTPSPGTSREFPSGVTIRTGNAGQVTVLVSGRAAQPFGGAGQVVTRRF
ncbi:RodZ domain-containing protein [Deinococcus sonorensis]|uniref:RodZ domain-containing protein n=2 Tax=Deinococcus sonorensis TaxID=309891 RepID=A0AAU7UB17_9DEIO